jgi:mono/diheme cytochrome c family protein
VRRVVTVGAFVAGILAALGVVALAITPDPELRNFEIFTEMVHSPAFGSQSENSFFADGMTQRPPVEGTIARGRIPLTGEETGVVELASPWAAAGTPGLLASDTMSRSAASSSPSDTLVARGKRVYTAFCSPCHGDAGLGDGPVARRGFPPPPSLTSENARGLSDGAVFLIVTNGRGNMPSLAGQVRRDDRWAAAAYIRSLQGASSEGAVR